MQAEGTALLGKAALNTREHLKPQEALLMQMPLSGLPYGMTTAQHMKLSDHRRRDRRRARYARSKYTNGLCIVIAIRIVRLIPRVLACWEVIPELLQIPPGAIARLQGTVQTNVRFTIAAVY